MSASPSKPRSVFSAVCRSNGIVLGRARATVGSRFSLNASRAPAYSNPLPVSPLGNVIAAGLPRLRKLAARVLERGGPLSCARTLAAAFTRIRRDIRPGFVNFCRTILAAGKPSFLSALVHDANQTASRFFVSFQFSPAFRSSVAAHAPNMMQKDARSHEQCTREYE